MNNLLSNKGLTSSEANHVTNITKELVKNLNLSNLNLFTATVLKSGIEHPLDENSKNVNWITDIKRSGELYSLSAWLKSAIKYKEQWLDDLNRGQYITSNTYILEKDVVGTKFDFETYLDSLSVKERNEYLSSESVASHIGKFVHSFDAIREQSDKFQPTSFTQINNEVVTVKNTRLYTKDELIDGFFELQKQHRESEKVVNYYKAKHKEWVKEISDKYSDAQKEVNFKNSEIIKEFSQKNEKERIEFEATKRQKMSEVSALKITIPNELQETLGYVNQYAKK